MNSTLHMLGEAVSIAALAIIATISWNAWQRIETDALVPVSFHRNGEPGMRLKKSIALLMMPVIATVLLLMLSAQPRGAAASGAGMMFTLQVIVAIGFTAAHLVQTKHAMEVLAREGKLRP